MEAERRAFDELRVDIQRMLDDQRFQLRSVVEELREDIRQMLQRHYDLEFQDIKEDVCEEASYEPTSFSACQESLLSTESQAAPTPGERVTRVASEAEPPCEEPENQEPRDQRPDDVREQRVSDVPRRAFSWVSNLLGDEVWEWQHADESWERYKDHTSQRIEQAFWRGETMTNVKSGKDGRTTMEIFFVDMVQLDPVSGRVRHVRRNGIQKFPFIKYPWMWVRRHMSGMAIEFATGRPQFESLNDYKDRERKELASTGLSVEGSEETFDFIGVNIDSAELSEKRDTRRHLYQALTTTFTFTAISMFVTILQSVFMGLVLNLEDSSVNLWHRSAELIAIEYFFCLFFFVELAMRYLALQRIREGIQDAWFCYDLLCVVLSIFEVVILPPLRLAGLVDVTTGSAQAFRIIRVGRLFRFIRLFRQFRDLNVVIMGFVHGMRSVVYILALLGILVFAFGYCIQTTIVSEEFKGQYFSDLGKSMRTLTFAGIFLDGVHKIGNEFVVHEEHAAMFLFFVFLLIAYFGLLNMLIGSFCNTAMQISQQEEIDADIRRLGLSLRGLLECYLSDGDHTMTRRQFKLIMKNMHVHNILRSCGTDIEALKMLEDVMFPTERSELHFNQFLGLVCRLRASAPACVSHMVCLAASIDHHFRQLKSIHTHPSRGRIRRQFAQVNNTESDAGLGSLSFGSCSRRPSTC